jgi:NADPH-dependent 7-cyano-7-deazaguanine reductase QueF
MMEDDILTKRLPIATGPRWGRIEASGLGVDVDEAKLHKYQAAYRKHGEFTTYVRKGSSSSK